MYRVVWPVAFLGTYANALCPSPFVEQSGYYMSGGANENPFPSIDPGVYGTANGPIGASLAGAKTMCEQSSSCKGFCHTKGPSGQDSDITTGVFFYTNDQAIADPTDNWISYTANPSYDPNCGSGTPSGPSGPGKGGEPDDLDVPGCSGGCAFLIVFFCGGFVYVVAGVVINRQKYGKEGAEMIPHINFWKDVPFLVKDGAMFLGRKIKGGSSAEYTAV